MAGVAGASLFRLISLHRPPLDEIVPILGFRIATAHGRQASNSGRGLPVEGDERLDLLIAEIDPVRVTDAQAQRWGKVQEVQIEDGLHARGPV